MCLALHANIQLVVRPDNNMHLKHAKKSDPQTRTKKQWFDSIHNSIDMGRHDIMYFA